MRLEIERLLRAVSLALGLFVVQAEAANLALPQAPTAPTSQSECTQLQRQWSAISDDLVRQHQACLDSSACKGTNKPRGYTGPCSCYLCHELHVVKDRLSSGDIASYRKAQIQSCEAQVRQHTQSRQAWERQQREMEERNRQQRVELPPSNDARRGAPPPAVATPQAAPPASSPQPSRPTAATVAIAIGQAMAARQAAAEAQQQSQTPVAYPRVIDPARDAPSPSIPSSLPVPTDPNTPTVASLNELESFSRELPVTVVDALTGIKKDFEELKKLRDSDETEVYVKTVQTAVKGFMTAFKARNWGVEGISATNALRRARYVVRRNPFMQIVEPFMDVENARNIDAAYQAAQRQRRSGTMNVNAARGMSEVEAELRRQQGYP